jgi:hypothetical protein
MSELLGLRSSGCAAFARVRVADTEVAGSANAKVFPGISGTLLGCMYAGLTLNDLFRTWQW